MLFLKLYVGISFTVYIFGGLYLYKKNQLNLITLIALIIFSIFWFPICIYEYIKG